MRVALVAARPEAHAGADLATLSLASEAIARGLLSRDEVRLFATADRRALYEIAAFEPDVIGYSVLTARYAQAVEFARELRGFVPDAQMIIGGHHISAVPDSLDDAFDVAVLGEGEETFCELLACYRDHRDYTAAHLDEIDGVAYRVDDGTLVKTNARTLIHDLNGLAHLDWTLSRREDLSVDRISYEGERAFRSPSHLLYSSRGCAFKCSFCATNTVWSKPGVRHFSVEYAGEAIQNLHDRHGARELIVLDDVFAYSKKRVENLIRELERRGLLGKIRFSHLYVRADLVDEEMIRLFARLGVASVFIGIESGSQRILGTLKDEKVTVEHVRKTVEFLGRHKVDTIGSFMVFCPGETREDIEQTLSFAEWFARQPATIHLLFSVATPFPGSELWNRYRERHAGPVDWDEFRSYHFTDYEMPRVWFGEGLTPEEQKSIWRRASAIRRSTPWGRRDHHYYRAALEVRGRARALALRDEARAAVARVKLGPAAFVPQTPRVRPRRKAAAATVGAKRVRLNTVP